MATAVSASVPQRRFSGGGRTIATVALFLVTFTLAVAIVASFERIRLTAPPLAPSLAHAIDTEGTAAALTEYRTLRARGFPGFSESEAATNDLAYRYLRAGHAGTALALFQLNVQTHPTSANVYDSLGEAYVDAGKRDLAIAEYRRAAAIDPDLKSTGIALAKLAGVRRTMIAPLGIFHVAAALTALLFGTLALVYRKGSRRHRWTGDVYVVAMLCMAGAGGYLAFVKSQPSNVLAASLTSYLVATAWAATRRRDGETDVFDWVALVAGATVAAAFATNFYDAARSGEDLVGPYAIFGLIALVAATSDVRMIADGGWNRPGRVARHLWRMSVTMVIATMSFFVGQQHLFPEAVRGSALLAAPGVLVIVVMLFWLYRVWFTKTYRTRVPVRPAGNALTKPIGDGVSA
jgi:uncharacterized membrane protein